MSENRGVLVLAEHRDQGLAQMTAEIVTAGRKLATELGEDLSAVLIGAGLEGCARELADLGLTKVFAVDDPELAHYAPEPYLAVVAGICADVQPRVVLMGHTDMGRDLAPRLAFKLDTGLSPNCVGLEVDGSTGGIRATRPVFGGKALGLFALGEACPCVVTIGRKVFEPATAENGTVGAVIPVAYRLDADDFRTSVVERVTEEVEGIRLEDATVIVSGGRGIGGTEGFAGLKELAAVLGGCVGASRPPVDNDWVPGSLQVGLTGMVVSPKVYLAVGISGAAQHMAGCSSATTIIAINRDADAPVFQRAHFGVVGDWREIVPALTAKCRVALG